MSTKEKAALAAFAIILIWQTLLPGYIGMANNGDFYKVAGPLCIAGADQGRNNFIHFQADYLRDPRFCLGSDIPSSERWIAGAASWVQQRLGDPKRFDIRWLGAWHAAGFLAAFYLWLRVLRPLTGFSWLIGVLLVGLVCSDVGFIAYANSFYPDAAALIGAMAAVPAAVLLWRDGSEPHTHSRAPVFVFGAAALLLVTSKAQHALLAIIPVSLILVAYRTRRLPIVVALTLLAGAAWPLATSPAWYRNQPLFNLIFYKILPASQTPAADANSLGLAPDDLQYIGKHTFLPDSPMQNPAWAEEFGHRAGYGKVLYFYLRHPKFAATTMWRDLVEQSPQRRPENLSNFRLESGKPAGARTARFGLWSSARAAAARLWPIHIVIWYALVLLGAPFVLRGVPRSSRALLAICWLVALAGLIEFSIASLADSLETYRHLLHFHWFTDATFLLAALGWLSRDKATR